MIDRIHFTQCKLSNIEQNKKKLSSDQELVSVLVKAYFNLLRVLCFLTEQVRLFCTHLKVFVDVYRSRGKNLLHEVNGPLGCVLN